MISKHKRLANFNDDELLELRRCAMQSGHVTYGRGGVARFIDDLMQYLLSEKKDVVIDFIELQKSTN